MGPLHTPSLSPSFYSLSSQTLLKTFSDIKHNIPFHAMKRGESEQRERGEDREKEENRKEKQRNE